MIGSRTWHGGYGTSSAYHPNLVYRPLHCPASSHHRSRHLPRAVQMTSQMFRRMGKPWTRIKPRHCVSTPVPQTATPPQYQTICHRPQLFHMGGRLQSVKSQIVVHLLPHQQLLVPGPVAAVFLYCLVVHIPTHPSAKLWLIFCQRSLN